jgi:hypothetical protein
MRSAPSHGAVVASLQGAEVEEKKPSELFGIEREQEGGRQGTPARTTAWLSPIASGSH